MSKEGAIGLGIAGDQEIARGDFGADPGTQASEGASPRRLEVQDAIEEVVDGLDDLAMSVQPVRPLLALLLVRDRLIHPLSHHEDTVVVPPVRLPRLPAIVTRTAASPSTRSSATTPC